MAETVPITRLRGLSRLTFPRGTKSDKGHKSSSSFFLSLWEWTSLKYTAVVLYLCIVSSHHWVWLAAQQLGTLVQHLNIRDKKCKQFLPNHVTAALYYGMVSMSGVHDSQCCVVVYLSVFMHWGLPHKVPHVLSFRNNRHSPESLSAWISGLLLFRKSAAFILVRWLKRFDIWYLLKVKQVLKSFKLLSASMHFHKCGSQGKNPNMRWSVFREYRYTLDCGTTEILAAQVLELLCAKNQADLCLTLIYAKATAKWGKLLYLSFSSV